MSSELPTVLVIDDERQIRRNISHYLEDMEEFTVLTSSNGEEALATITTNSVDVAVVDMRLPGMSGIEFIKAAQTISKHTRYLIHTGSTDLAVSGGLDEIGLTQSDLLIKPASLEALRRRILERLNRKNRPKD